MSESPRTCATCACCRVIEPPVLATKQIPDPTRMRAQYVCRLNPPMTKVASGRCATITAGAKCRRRYPLNSTRRVNRWPTSQTEG